MEAQTAAALSTAVTAVSIGPEKNAAADDSSTGDRSTGDKSRGDNSIRPRKDPGSTARTNGTAPCRSEGAASYRTDNDAPDQPADDAPYRTDSDAPDQPADDASYRTDNDAPDRTIHVPIYFWEKHRRLRECKLCRVVSVEEGAPLVWALGRLAKFCSEILALVVDPEASDGLRFEIKGAEAFWFTPVEQPVPIHVYRDVD